MSEEGNEPECSSVERMVECRVVECRVVECVDFTTLIAIFSIIAVWFGQEVYAYV